VYVFAGLRRQVAGREYAEIAIAQCRGKSHVDGVIL
jgi:hypothetical protein